MSQTEVKSNVYFFHTLTHNLLMPQEKRSSTKPKRLKPRRDTVSFRLLPETKEMLDRAVVETDTTLGRYIEKALRAQFRKDGIKETE
jgi:hypothetical protein